MMNPVFAASRSMGRSWVYARGGKEKEARKALSEAGKAFGTAGLSGAQRVVRGLGSSSADDFGKIAEGFHQQIQAELKKNLKSYYAASAGWCLGLAELACSLMTKADPLAEAKKAIDEWLTVARKETDALRTQKLVPGMKDFTAMFKSHLGGIHAITDPTKWGEFHGCGQLIKDLANQVGNAIG